MKHTISMDSQISYLGIMSTHHPTFHLEVWLHVLPLPIYIEISPSWRSLLEWKIPLDVLFASPILAGPQRSETASKAAC